MNLGAGKQRFATDQHPVFIARRQLMDAIYAIAGVTHIKVDEQLARNLDAAWDAYDQAVARTAGSTLSDAELRDRLRWPRSPLDQSL